MAASRGWVSVFVLAVTTLIGCGEGQLKEGALSGCTRERRASSTVGMECDFANRSVRLNAGQFPPSIQTVRMSNAEGIFIAKDTFSSLHSLKSIHLNDVRTLQINKNDWTRIEQPGQVTITINRVYELSLHSGAFSGWSKPGPKIVIRNVTKCDISKEAFKSDSTIQRVVLQNIQTLALGINAFQTDVGQLKLDNVSLDKGCQSGSFRGRIRNLSLHSVKIDKLSTGCLNTGQGWAASLTIRSSYLGNIRPNSIRGRVINVVIENSSLGHVEQEGMKLVVSSFTLNSTVIEELATNALDVNFNQSASLQGLTISSLRVHALRGLKPLSDGATLTIQRVSVVAADDGSLAFSKPTQVTLLDVELPDQCRCGVDKQAFRLVIGDEPPHKATDEQKRAAAKIFEQVSCKTSTGTMTLAEFNCQKCSAKDGGNAQCSSPLLFQTSTMATQTAVRLWVPVGVGALLLLLALGAVVAMVKRRCSRQREEYPPDDQLRSDCKAQDVTPEPVYEAISEYVPPGHIEIPVYDDLEERHTSSAFRAPSSTGHPYALQTESEYSDVYSPGLPRPPSYGYEHFEMSPRSAVIPGQSLELGQDVYANLHGEQHY